jgi:hypothetical protein
MLDEKQLPAWLENAPHLDQGRERVPDRAQRPGHHYRIEDRLGEGEIFRRGPHQRHRNGYIRRSLARQYEQFGRWINGADAIDTSAVEGKIHARTDSDLKHQASCVSDGRESIRVQRVIPHGSVKQAGEKASSVEAHGARCCSDRRRNPI